MSYYDTQGAPAQSPAPTPSTPAVTGDSPSQLGNVEQSAAPTSPMGGQSGQSVPAMHMPPPGMTGGPPGMMMGGHWNGALHHGGMGLPHHNGFHHVPHMQPHPNPYMAAHLMHHYHQQQQYLFDHAGDAAVATMPDWQHQPTANMSAEKMLFNQANSGINFDNYENIPVEMSGEDTPVAIERFTDADLHTWIQENIARSGYTKPTPVQKNSIPALISGRDLMSCAQTGSGKTAAFLVPIINNILLQGPQGIMQPSMNSSGRRCFFPSALVLSPTRELAMQIHKEADKFSYRTNIITSILYGGRENYRDQINRLRAGCHILIATPGRLIDIIEQGYIGLNGIRYLVLDEADRMLDMGFEPQIRKVIGLSMPDKQKRTTAMFSATFPKEIQMLAQDFLKENYVFLAVGRVGSTSENIEQHVEWVEEHEKKKGLCSILEVTDINSLVLVFVETKRGANELSWFLQRQNVRAVAIHGDLKQFERERNLELFRTGKCNVLVATAVAARGLDIPNVRHVVNFDLPNDSDEYVHRIGRTGRCGNTGIATSFFNDKNRGIARDLQGLLAEAHQEIPDFIRRCAAEGGASRGARGRFGGTDHRRGGRGGGRGSYGSSNGFGGVAAGGMQRSNSFQSNGFGQQQNGFGGGNGAAPMRTGNGFGGGYGSNGG
ncbi:hypothetical protein PENTCL1PPCAC_26776, partial [Pristionchus entomophagus]